MPPVPAHPGQSHGFAVELDAVERALSVDARTGSPPPELMAQMADAGSVHDRLAAEGIHLAFPQAPVGRAAEITVRAADGAAIRALSPAEAIAIAAGKQLG